MTTQTHATRFFYQGDKLVTITDPEGGRTIVRGLEVPLAEHAQGSEPGTQLLATDLQHSVLVASGESD